MKNLGAALVLVGSLVGVGVGCGGADSAGIQDGDTKSAGIGEGSRQAYGVLTFLNDPATSYSMLVSGVGLSTKAAASIAKRVRGEAWQGAPAKPPKGVPGPAPGEPLTSIAELDALPSVGVT